MKLTSGAICFATADAAEGRRAFKEKRPPRTNAEWVTFAVSCGVVLAVAGLLVLGVLPHNSGVYPQLTARENIAYFGELQGLGRAQHVGDHRAVARVRRAGSGGRALGARFRVVDGRGPFDDVEVTEGHGVEGTGTDCPSHGHEPSGAVGRTRAWPHRNAAHARAPGRPAAS